MARTLILGGGFGGITVATELRQRLGDEHEVVLVDRGERFVMGLRKLWEPVGIGTLEEGSRPLAALGQRGIRFLRREIRGIDPAARRIATDQGDLEGDYLVVALGAEVRPDLVPGLAEHTHNVWDFREVAGLASALARFRGGRIAVVIAGVPYTCPPAPYECAMLVDDHLRERGLRDRSQIGVATLQPMLLPNAGREGSARLAQLLMEREIEFQTGRKVVRFESGRAIFPEGELEADLIIGVPPHRVPAVIQQSGLTGDGEWIRVDPATLATGWERVFAIGDVTAIQLSNGLPLPKAGVMAEREGERVAAAIVADIRGDRAAAEFDGTGYCFMEVGMSSAALIQGEFFAKPEPRVSLAEASPDHAAEKRRFETERLIRWFGA